MTPEQTCAVCGLICEGVLCLDHETDFERSPEGRRADEGDMAVAQCALDDFVRRRRAEKANANG